MNAHLGIPHDQLQPIALRLNGLLADEYLLYTKTKNYHWNVTGPHFHALHELFDAQAETLEDHVDDIAERVRALGYRAAGSMKDFLTLATLAEDHGAIPDGLEMVAALCNDHETLIRELRSAIDQADAAHDSGTADLLTAIMEAHEKMAWMLRSHSSVKTSDNALRNLDFQRQPVRS